METRGESAMWSGKTARSKNRERVVKAIARVAFHTAYLNEK
jgi:hypothetical protein